jgi:exodeoxyribonuclease VII small subunit
MAASPPEDRDVGGMSFEDAMAELEGIVERLESGEATLDDSIALYERGAALRAHCDARLKDAEMRVEKIVAGDGGPATVPLDAPAAKPAARGGAPAAASADGDDIPF